MKRLLFIFCFYSVFLKAQVECATPTPSVDFLSTINPQFKSPKLNNANIKLFFHIVRRNNGTGNLSLNEVIQGFHSLQAQFNPHNICFTFYGYDFINNKDLFENFDVSKESALISQNPHSDAIDIYIITKEDNKDGFDYPYNGLAIDGIPGKTIIVKREGLSYGGTTLAHELGHCLGLYHTFETKFCIENINGSNSKLCGDLVEDTPADYNWMANNQDPNSKVDALCNYIGGMGYSPLTNNLMSYYQNCRSDFTNGQGERMLEVISESQILLNCLISDYKIVSPVIFPLYPSGPSCNQPIPPPSCPPPIYNLTITGKIKLSTFGSVIISAFNPNNNPFNYTTTIGFVSENEIELFPGFEAHQGVKFAAVIDPICPVNINFRENGGESNITNRFFETEKRSHNKYGEKESKTSKSNYSIDIAPNPNNGEFTLSMDKNMELPNIILVFDCQGKEIKRIEKPNKYKYDFSLAEFSSGIYVMNIFFSDNVISKRIIKN